MVLNLGSNEQNGLKQAPFSKQADLNSRMIIVAGRRLFNCKWTLA